MRKDWGFDYFTLDLLYAAVLPGVRYDSRLTRAEVLALGLSLIRDSAGADAILHGCNAPISASIGLVDIMSVGCGISHSWNQGTVDQLIHSAGLYRNAGRTAEQHCPRMYEQAFLDQ